jgi:hypothetical protein
MDNQETDTVLAWINGVDQMDRNQLVKLLCYLTRVENKLQ